MEDKQHKTIGVLVVSKGRASLRKTLDSIYTELGEKDACKVILDGVKKPRYHKKYPKIEFIEEDFKGFYGHPHREAYQSSFETKYILNVDDDDELTVGWREMLKLLLRRDKWDLIIWNYILEKNKRLALYTSGQVPPITGNVVFKNTEKLTKKEWGDFVGADYLRVLKMLEDKTLKVCYTEFPIMIKH